MTIKSYTKHGGTRKTSVAEPIPGRNTEMGVNPGGGYGFPTDKWTQLNRFLITGSAGSTYYVKAKELTKDNLGNVLECIKDDGARVVRTIVEISDAGRAFKNEPAIFALAACAGAEDVKTRKAALDALPKVCRIGTHLFQFVEAVKEFRGFGRGLTAAIANWYTGKTPEDLAYQMLKYRQREGMSHHDVLHLCHAKAENPLHNGLFAWAKQQVQADRLSEQNKLALEGLGKKLPQLGAFEEAQKTDNVKQLCKLIREHRLSREMLPTEWLGKLEVWAALFEDMPMTAMIRNAGKMSNVGLLKPMSTEARTFAERLRNPELIKKARIHPMAVILFLRRYASGHGDKGDLTWTAVPSITEAGEDAFYLSFGNVEPTGKRFVMGVDVSGSMSGGQVAGISGFSCREAAAVMAMAIVRSEPSDNFVFIGYDYKVRPLNINKKMSLLDVTNRIPSDAGGTDCSLPMGWAKDNKIDADAFVNITDCDTNTGNHPCQVLNQYRQARGINAKMVVCAMTAENFTIADPKDAGTLDVAGMDANVPTLVSNFVKDGF